MVKRVVLGVTGSIAAYKAAEIASKLTQEGMEVDVIMTREATQFISPLTFRALTGRPVAAEPFKSLSEFGIDHISLARSAEVIAIAPATANIIAKLAVGIADDILSSTVLATEAPVLIAPAMETHMYNNPATQRNLAILQERGFTIVGPDSGWLASGKKGLGRLTTVENILGVIHQLLGRQGDLAGKHIVVTAGGTQEPIDPVRYIGNRSSGKMGYAIAEAARDRGAKVTLVTAPVSLPEPAGIDTIRVRTAQEMYEVVKDVVPKADAIIMSAAVADYRPASTSKEKIKKRDQKLLLELEPTPDILEGLKGEYIKVGFAAETGAILENAVEKLKRKGLHFIVANDITAHDSGFDVDTNRVTIIDRENRIEELPLMTKREVAEIILDKVAGIFERGSGKLG
jgi:phosphopantothenoylcysteine decarboxylase/phosphopantothenate--cysteine ligase